VRRDSQSYRPIMTAPHAGSITALRTRSGAARVKALALA
jgi:hypothetical protein